MVMVQETDTSKHPDSVKRITSSKLAMPVITIKGGPSKIPNNKLVLIREDLAHVVTSFRRLNLKRKDISFFFPLDRQIDLDNELIIEVSGLFTKPERTQEVKDGLAKNLALCLKGFFPKAKVECFVRSFDPQEEGFCVLEASE